MLSRMGPCPSVLRSARPRPDKSEKGLQAMTAPQGSAVRLSRALPNTPPAAPVRIVHLGVGNFHRAHQAWYTAHTSDADQWGIAGFTGRAPDMADALAPQDGL